MQKSISIEANNVHVSKEEKEREREEKHTYVEKNATAEWVAFRLGMKNILPIQK